MNAEHMDPLQLETLVRRLSGTQLKVVLTMGLLSLPATTRKISGNCGLGRATVLAALDQLARQGLVQRDGDVTAVDGISALSFNAAPGNYHVAVRHRNHLGAMTASPVALSGTATPLNFKIPGLGTWGTNAQKLIAGARVLWAGDATSNGQVKYTGAGNDRDPILTIVGSNSPNGIVNGYSTRDVNLNGQVKYTGSGNDRDPILLNVGSASPNATRIGQLP